MLRAGCRPPTTPMLVLVRKALAGTHLPPPILRSHSSDSPQRRDGRLGGKLHLHGRHPALVQPRVVLGLHGFQLRRHLLGGPLCRQLRRQWLRLQPIPRGCQGLLRPWQDGQHQLQVHRRHAVPRLRQQHLRDQALLRAEREGDPESAADGVWTHGQLDYAGLVQRRGEGVCGGEVPVQRAR